MRMAIILMILSSTVLVLGGCAQFAQARESARLTRDAAHPKMAFYSSTVNATGGGPTQDYDETAKTKSVQMVQLRDAAGFPQNQPPSNQDASLAILAQSQPDRYLIRNATLTVETGDVREAVKKLMVAVALAHGYLADMHESTDGLGVMTATMNVRVPYTGFDRSMQEIGGLGKVLERQVTAEDVTEEFVDTQARIRNLKNTEVRLLEHLSRTGRLADTLLVEKELNRVREEIEQHEGRVRFLAHRIAFSTISLTLHDKPRQMAYVPAETYSPAKEGSEAVRSLVDFGRGVLTRLIWVTVWLPVWGPLAFGAWLAVRIGRVRYVHWAKAQPSRPVVPSSSAVQS